MNTAAVDAGISSFASRLWNYLRIMYPVGPRLAAACVMTLGFRAMLRLGEQIPLGLPKMHALLGTLSVFLFLLILRLMDELKDIEIDMKLFQDRPLPSGLVRESDIRAALWGAAGLFLLINLSMPAAFPFAVMIFVYALLMFAWFFQPAALRPNLWLTLITHNPVVALMFVYLAAVVADEQSLELSDLKAGAVSVAVLLYWFLGLAWEISRKIRQKHEENSYVTYSKLLGRRGALAIAVGAQTVAVSLAVGLFLTYGKSVISPALVIAAYSGAIANAVWHWRSTHARTTSLKAWSEILMFSTCAAAVLEEIFSR